MQKAIFRTSTNDKDGYMLERRTAIVVTGKADDFFEFMPAVAHALREIADQIDAATAGNDAYEKHKVRVDDLASVEVELVSLDGTQWKDGPTPEVPVNLSDALRILTPQEIAAIS